MVASGKTGAVVHGAWRLWYSWTVASLMGTLVLLPIWYFDRRYGKLDADVLVGLAIIGVIVGFMQWLVLRPQITLTPGQVLVWMAAGAVGGLSPLAIILGGSHVIGTGLIAGLLSLTVGTLQALVLSKHF